MLKFVEMLRVSVSWVSSAPKESVALTFLRVVALLPSVVERSSKMPTNDGTPRRRLCSGRTAMVDTFLLIVLLYYSTKKAKESHRMLVCGSRNCEQKK